MKKLLLACCFLGWTGNIFGQYTVRVVLQRIPLFKNNEPVYLAGNFNSWDPADSACRVQALQEKRILTIKDVPEGAYAFKFTRGSWQSVECDNEGNDIGNRTVVIHSDTALYFQVVAWKDQFPPGTKQHTMNANVHIMDTAFFMPQLDRFRRIWIYLPADYSGANQHYPVLYMQDGQNLFDAATAAYGEWRVDETLDSLAKKGLPEVIVVGIDNGQDKRLNEYNPFDNEKYGKGEGEAYVDFLVKTLKPFIDDHYRTLPQREHTAIAGSSMGGLISFYAALKYPGVFGKAGIFSPSFWIAPQLYDTVKNGNTLKNTLIYFVAGGMESDGMVPDMQRMYNLLLQHGEPAANMKEVIVPDGQHSESYWRQEFPNACLWLFAR